MHPLSPNRRLASPADMTACRAMLAEGSKTFMLASYLLPWRVRDSAISLYAFCRQADDAVDKGDEIDALEQLSDRLDAIYEGRPSDSPADRAFADTVAQFALPKAIPQALLEGFAWDVSGRIYRTIEDVEAYGARVAGTVGAMMALVMGVEDPGVMARACDLGVAMQLSNIARDVGEDAKMGRLYLPLDWLVEEGVDAVAFLRKPEFSPAIGRVVQRLLDRADVFYRSADFGIAALPAGCRPAIRAARLLYAEIGRAVERNNLDSVSQRAYAPLSRKLALAGQAALAAPSRAHPGEPVLGETEFMIDASQELRNTARPTRWDITERLIWSADLLHRQDYRKSRSAHLPDPRRFREVGRTWNERGSLATNG
jgi:15-cis-phytoene synthase